MQESPLFCFEIYRKPVLVSFYQGLLTYLPVLERFRAQPDIRILPYS